MRLDQTVLDVARMAGRIAQAQHAGDGGEPLKQLAERPASSIRPFAVIGVDVLPDQGDLAHAVIGKPRHILDDPRHGTRDFCATRVRHDAEGAELVAAFLYGDES